MTNKLDTKIYQLAEATTQVSFSHPAQVTSPHSSHSCEFKASGQGSQLGIDHDNTM